METTIIQIKKETAHLLKEFKKFNRQSYDEVIRNLMESAEAECLTKKEMKDIEEALNDVKRGKVYKIEDIAREFGIRLKS